MGFAPNQQPVQTLAAHRTDAPLTHCIGTLLVAQISQRKCAIQDPMNL
jgi:hypothetical protein